MKDLLNSGLEAIRWLIFKKYHSIEVEGAYLGGDGSEKRPYRIVVYVSKYMHINDYATLIQDIEETFWKNPQMPEFWDHITIKRFQELSPTAELIKTIYATVSTNTKEPAEIPLSIKTMIENCPANDVREAIRYAIGNEKYVQTYI